MLSAQQELRPPDALRPCDEINLELSPIHSSTDADQPIHRKHPDHGVFISAKNPAIVFLAVCCDKRQPWLATTNHHDLLMDIWQDTCHWVVGRYVVMPDHLHLFASPQESAVTFDAWVKYWKSQFTKRNKNPRCVWQTDHWDTCMRNQQHYEEKSEYMFANPVRAGLTDEPTQWPFRGIVHEIRWD